MNYAVRIDNITFRYPGAEYPVFENLSIKLPHGVSTFMGQNGTGKSTLLLLAAARILPESGKILLLDRETGELQDETLQNQYASFLYQNMEFESEEKIGKLLEFVYENGFCKEKTGNLIKTLVDICELENILLKKIGEISKGELQRTIIAFSLLYGSKTIFMDEPVFALEKKQKEKIMDFIVTHSRENKISYFYSAHDISISEKYSDYLVLFHKDRSIKIGKTAELLTKENIENAYQMPEALLYQHEHLHRTHLIEAAKKANSNFCK